MHKAHRLGGPCCFWPKILKNRCQQAKPLSACIVSPQHFTDQFAMDSTRQPLDRELILERISPATRTWVSEIGVHEEIDSTNTHLMTRATAEDIDGVVCIAERQTAGRGRRGRTWLTPSGGAIALSLGKHLSVAVAEIAPLSLVVGLAVANAMRDSGISGVSLKWPNDILLDGAKVGGILIELAAITQPLKVVIGVGINVGAGAEVRTRLGIPVGDVREKNRTISRNDLAAGLIDNIHGFATRFEQQGFPAMRSEWETLHAHQEHHVLLIGANETVEGIARGVTASGELVLETDSGIRHFSGGEVSLRGAHGGV
jgi:BirA family transcriptional regulator, biotin operon repressor / biotin---[acetyl-CoA-carboxylase] ligase